MSEGHTFAYQWTRDEFDAETWEQIDGVIARHAGREGALIPVLEEAQEIAGYLPEALLRRVAAGLNLPLSQVYGVATFYSYFTMVPRGRNQVRLCLGTACHVQGARENLDALSKMLEIGPGECCKNREFSLEVVRCLGACGLAPVMMINEDTHRQVKPDEIESVLAAYGDADPSSER